MSLIVMKFGGTSVGDADRIRQAASIVKEHAQRGNQVVVVVSALSKVTDLILKVLDAARMGNACGAIIVTRHGCANFMPTLDEVAAFVAARGEAAI